MSSEVKCHDLTQVVNLFGHLPLASPQLQKAKGLLLGGSEFVFLEFFPEPRGLLLARSSRGPVVVYEKPEGAQVVEKAKPWLLYLRSHFKGKRVFQVLQSADGKMEWHFDRDGQWKWLWEFRASEMIWHFVIPSRKEAFVAYLECPDLRRLEQNRVLDVSQTLGTSPTTSEPNKKFLKLIQNLKSDLKSAEDWLESHKTLTHALEADPTLWGSLPSSELQAAFGSAFTFELASGKWPAWRTEFAAQANTLFFETRRRMERKKRAVKSRIDEVQSGAATSERNPSPKSDSAKSTSRSTGPHRKPGLWIPLTTQAWARVGRNARENEELYRQASDRDYWFHVRSQPGSHVWIPRGQPGLGSKDEISSDWVQKGAELAVWNSKLALGSSVEVDWTEKRYLRSRKGVLGALEVHRSKTFFVRWTEERVQHWKKWLSSRQA